MKKILLCSIMMVFGISVFAQSTFEIKNIGTQYTSEQITNAFSSADFCGSYFNSKRNILVFNDGSIIELKSAFEITSTGISLAPSCLLSNDAIYFESIWSISPEGFIMKGFDNNAFPSEKAYYHYNNLIKQ